jgi:predicted transporter
MLIQVDAVLIAGTILFIKTGRPLPTTRNVVIGSGAAALCFVMSMFSLLFPDMFGLLSKVPNATEFGGEFWLLLGLFFLLMLIMWSLKSQMTKS